MNNMAIRLKARELGIPLWRIADEVGVSEMTLYRWLRHELDPDKKKLLESAIRKLVRRK